MSTMLSEAVSSLCVLAAKLAAEDQRLLQPALVLLSAELAAESPEPKTRRQLQLERIAELERQLIELSPGERAEAIQQRMSLSRSQYYRLRSEAVEQKLSPKKSQKIP